MVPGRRQGHSMKRVAAGAAVLAVIAAGWLLARGGWQSAAARNPLAYPSRVAIPSDLPTLKLGYENNKDEQNVPVWALCHPLYLEGHFCGWQRCLMDAATTVASLDPKPWLQKELFGTYGQQSIATARSILMARTRGIEDGYRSCAALAARERGRLSAAEYGDLVENAQLPCGSCSPLCDPPEVPIPELDEGVE